jgi:hypothetical protein
MKKWVAFLLLGSIVALNSCRFTGKRVKGNGHVITENRGLSGFTGVVSEGSFDVYVSAGSPASVRIEGEDNILPYIETYVDNNILRVDTKEKVWLRPRRTIKIYVVAPHYRKIHSRGSGNIIGQTKITDSSRMDLVINGNGDIKVDVDAPEVSAEVTGNGGINVTGQSKTFKGSLMGNGNISAFNLLSEDTNIRIMGNGDAEVFASVHLDVTIGGNGDVRYKGGGQISTHITGNGNVKKVD